MNKLQYNTIVPCIIILILLCYIYYNNLSINNNNNTRNNDKIKILVRQASRWSVAALQDKNPLIATLHANYGMGFLLALKNSYTQNEIEKATGIELKKFEHMIRYIQDKTTKHMIKICPKFAPTQPKYLAKFSGQQ
jgi:hypothetical protein